jgi:hypothetical protein
VSGFAALPLLPGSLPRPAWALATWRGVALTILLSACAETGDLGRTRPGLFPLDRTDSIGAAAARAAGEPASIYALTEDEKLLRNLAYGLIAPPIERDLWDRVVSELQRTGVLAYQPQPLDPTAYATKLMTTPYRSATARYGRLIEDVRDDLVRLDQFAAVAQRVADMDRKREKSLGYVSTLSGDEWVNAMRRIGENAVIIGWVQRCLAERAGAYRFALERLVIATPLPAAVEAERAIGELDRRVTAMAQAAPVVVGRRLSLQHGDRDSSSQ